MPSMQVKVSRPSRKASLATLGLIAGLGMISAPRVGEGQEVLHPKDLAFTGRLQMQTRCAYGSHDCNVCVNGVRKGFEQLRDGFDTDANVYSFKWHDGCASDPASTTCFTSNPGDGHLQSVMRFAKTKNDGSLLVTTRSVGEGAGRFGVIRMGDYDGSPFPWRGQPIKAGENRLVSWGRVGKLQNGFLNHASGAQMLGRLLFTGVECYHNSSCEQNDARVQIIDLSNPEMPVERAVIQLDRGAADAAVARLDDGYLLMVHTQNDDNDKLMFYRSTKLDTGWNRIGTWDSEWLKGIDDNFGCDFDTYQNTHLVTQCDGKLFMVGFCYDTFPGTDWADLYQIGDFARRDKIGVGVPSITKIGKKTFGMAHLASFKFGGGVYVDPDHRMSIYAIAASTWPTQSTVYVNEFSAKRK